MTIIYEYALVSPDLLVYTGRAGPGYLSKNKRDAFLYTEDGAHGKIARSPLFKNFTVVHVENIGTTYNMDKTDTITAIWTKP